MDNHTKCNLERWKAWMQFDNGKYGYYLTHYDPVKVRKVSNNKVTTGDLLDAQGAYL